MKQNASAVVARAAAGEILTITDRGRPVARLTPIRRSRLEQGILEGWITPATRSAADRPTPKPAPPGITASEVLRQVRDEERY